MKTKQPKSDEMEFYLAAKEMIDKKVSDKIATLTKSHQKVDIHKIEEQAQKNYFDELTKSMEHATNDFAVFMHQLEHDRKDIFLKLSNPEPVPKHLEKKLKEAKSLKELKSLFPEIPLTQEDFKELYEQGKKWYEGQHFDKALLYFQFLSLNERKKSGYWIAKGLTEQSLEKYHEALVSYTKAIELDPDHARNYLHVIECFLLLDHFEEAKHMYSILMENSRPEEYSDDEYFVSRLKVLETAFKNPK